MSGTLQKKDLKSSLLKKRKSIPVVARAVIRSTSNNNFVTITDLNGDVIHGSTAGAKNFKGTRSATPYAAQVTAFEVAQKAHECGVRTVSVVVRGFGSGRDSAILALKSAGLKISSLSYDIKIAHNGCKPRNRRKT
jgi:small subunit ribosomal protein S11